MTDYQQFLHSPGAIGSGVLNMANYNAGYCFFKKKDYRSALTSFRKFLSSQAGEEPVIVNDA